MKKLGNILFVLDDRLSREKTKSLLRTLLAFRTFANVDIVEGPVSEEEVLKKVQAKIPQLILAPWHRYLTWPRVEAVYGLTRTSGPTFAGYFVDPVQPEELGDRADQRLRAILLDFGALDAAQSSVLVRALIVDQQRAGLTPLLEPTANIYCENWYGQQGMGMRLDAALAIPEINEHGWTKVSNALRVSLLSLWSLVYEEGPGKSEFAQAISGNTPKAYFQMAADRNSLLLRLGFSMSNWTQKDLLARFFPTKENPFSPAQLLRRSTDFIRVHQFPESNEIEIVAGFLSPESANRPIEALRSVWIEPLTNKLLKEPFFEAPNPNSKQLKALPTPQPQDSRVRLESSNTRINERVVVEAAAKIRELKEAVAKRDEQIRELKSGGVGTSQPLPPPDAEALLEAFQSRFFDAQFQIRQLELQIVQFESKGARPEQIEDLRLKIAALTSREQSWIKKLASTIEEYRKMKRH